MRRSKKEKKCESGKILNPKSNRCVDKKGPTGKHILSQIEKSREELKKVIEELIETGDIITKGDLKKALDARDIKYRKLDNIIYDIMTKRLKKVVREIIDTGKIMFYVKKFLIIL